MTPATASRKLVEEFLDEASCDQKSRPAPAALPGHGRPTGELLGHHHSPRPVRRRSGSEESGEEIPLTVGRSDDAQRSGRAPRRHPARRRLSDGRAQRDPDAGRRAAARSRGSWASSPFRPSWRDGSATSRRIAKPSESSAWPTSAAGGRRAAPAQRQRRWKLPSRSVPSTRLGLRQADDRLPGTRLGSRRDPSRVAIAASGWGPARRPLGMWGRGTGAGAAPRRE